MSQGIVVTGAGDSVGRVIAEKFLERGLKVHIADLRPEAVESTLAENPGMTGVVANIGHPKDVDALFDTARQAFADLVALVNCVGIGGPRGLTEDLDAADWKATFDVNVHGILYTMQKAIPWMKRAGQGAIVNFSSASTRTRLPWRSAYISSKFALEGLTLNAARELGPHGIRCNAILPGIIDNQRMRTIMAARAEQEGRPLAEVEAAYTDYISMRSKVSPAELADAVLYLCSPAARMVTGELMAVSGNLEWET